MSRLLGSPGHRSVPDADRVRNTGGDDTRIPRLHCGEVWVHAGLVAQRALRHEVSAAVQCALDLHVVPSVHRAFRPHRDVSRLDLLRFHSVRWSCLPAVNGPRNDVPRVLDHRDVPVGRILVRFRSLQVGAIVSESCPNFWV